MSDAEVSSSSNGELLAGKYRLMRRLGENAEITALGFGLIAALLGRQPLMQQPFQPRLLKPRFPKKRSVPDRNRSGTRSSSHC